MTDAAERAREIADKHLGPHGAELRSDILQALREAEEAARAEEREAVAHDSKSSTR